MLNDHWEEKGMPSEISDFHEASISKLDLPEWIAAIKCPFCQKELPMRSIRTVGMKFNARNMGDIVVEVLCDDCSKMDTLYFREQCDIPKFINLLSGVHSPSSDPVIEEEMFTLNYNNLLEDMASERK